MNAAMIPRFSHFNCSRDNRDTIRDTNLRNVSVVASRARVTVRVARDVERRAFASNLVSSCSGLKLAPTEVNVAHFARFALV